MPAHLAARAPLSRTRRTLRAILAAIGAFGVAISVALAAAGGTYAYLSSSAPLNAGTLTSGTSDLTIQNVASYSIVGLDTSALLPGASVFTSTPLTVKNVGDASLSVTQGAASFSAVKVINSHLTIKVGRVTGTTCTAGAGTVLGSGFTLAAGATMKVCVTVTLSSGSPGTVAGQSTSFTVPLDGLQVRP